MRRNIQHLTKYSNYRLTEKDHARLKRAARLNQTSMSEIIELALKEYFKTMGI